MSDKKNINFGGASIGGVNIDSTVHGDQIGTQHNYAPEQKQNIAEVAAEIQQLLDQLEQTNPTQTEAQLIVNQAIERQPLLKEPQVIEQAIKSTPSLKARLQSAGKAVYVETVKVLLPPVGVVIEGWKAWNNPEE